MLHVMNVAVFSMWSLLGNEVFLQPANWMKLVNFFPLTSFAFTSNL